MSLFLTSNIYYILCTRNIAHRPIIFSREITLITRSVFAVISRHVNKNRNYAEICKQKETLLTANVYSG